MSLSTIAESPITPEAVPPAFDFRRATNLFAALGVGVWFELVRSATLFSSGFTPMWFLASLGLLVALWSALQRRNEKTLVSIGGTAILALVASGLIFHAYKDQWLPTNWFATRVTEPADLYNFVVLVPMILILAWTVPVGERDGATGDRFAPSVLRGSFRSLLLLPRSLGEAVQLLRVGSRSGWSGTMWGIVFSIPVCAVLAALLSADHQFRTATEYLETKFGSVLAHTFWAALFSFVAATFLALFRKDAAAQESAPEPVTTEPAQNTAVTEGPRAIVHAKPAHPGAFDELVGWWRQVRNGPAMNTAFVAFFVPLGMIFALYAVANLPSFFVADAAIRAHGGPTYAMHLHRGFAESVVASMLACSLVWGELTLRGNAQLPSRAIVWMQGTLLVLASVAVVSCAQRLVLYVNAYGLTPKRVFVGFFVLVALGTFALTTRRVVHRSSTRLSGNLYAFYAVVGAIMGLFPYFLVAA